MALIIGSVALVSKYRYADRHEKTIADDGELGLHFEDNLKKVCSHVTVCSSQVYELGVLLVSCARVKCSS